MIKFEKDVEKVFPYDRIKYIDYFDNRADTSMKWYGVSFQLANAFGGEEIKLKEYVEMYLPLFRSVVLKFENPSFWIVNHDDKDLDWFPNDADNLSYLRSLFKQNNIPNSFRGALIFSNDELLVFAKDLISYPYVVLGKNGFLYKDLDISNSELQFIIKISGHMNIDFLSTDKKILEKIVTEYSTKLFIVKEYKDN